MSLIRRFAAAGFAASVLVLGACSNEAPVGPTPEQNTGDVTDNPRVMFADNTTFLFTDIMGQLTGPQTLSIGGLVAIGSFVNFDNVIYEPSVTPWLRRTTTPVFQREPLRWLFTLSVDPAVYETLDDGVYTAHFHASTPAAINPRIGIDAILCKGGECLPINGTVNGELNSATDGTWNRPSNDVNSVPGSRYFDDYFMAVPPFTTVHITNHGGCSGFGLSDPYLHVFDLDDNLIALDDDGFGCLNSYIALTNNSSNTEVYRVRASSFGSFTEGSYQLRTSTAGPFLMAPTEVSPEFAEIIRQKAGQN